MKKANYRKHNDGSLNSSTYHKKDGTEVRAILKREAEEEIADAFCTRAKLQELAATIATTFFRDMQSPPFRGPNFTWEEFPEMAAKLAETSVFMSFPETEKLTRAEELFAADVARKTARVLVEKAGLTRG